MDQFDTDTLKRLVSHYLNRADLCREEAKEAEDVYWKNHLQGRATAFEDAAYMLVSRFPEAKP